ncbi:unnamed protein product [Spirodela intermedia]|uniref:Uncharacterized protein n=1 Tax=Spirodela intermedia TaxID=51605 RepID=A0A7I8J0Y8_SPIIN|nr:unnamed protein product [Spirodela intermedia]CAA6663709.1 unnamed protein product [Spirodela intermedia]
MGNRKVTPEQISVVRSVVGGDFPEMDIIRALHLANNDPTAAINIIFDAPAHFQSSVPASQGDGAGATPPSPTTPATHAPCGMSGMRKVPGATPSPSADHLTHPARDADSVDCHSEEGATSTHVNCVHYPPEAPSGDIDRKATEPGTRDDKNNDWWLVGRCDLTGLSTCKGRRLKAGELVSFSFPSTKVESSSSTARFPSRGRQVASCSEIVRFATPDSGEIGRIPNEWARCLVPLVKMNKVRIEGCCKSAPDVLSIMDTLLLSVSVYINIRLFGKHHQTPLKSSLSATEGMTIHPLSTLFKLIGLEPFKKAEFTPEDLLSRKRPLECKEMHQVLASVLPSENGRKLTNGTSNSEKEHAAVSDSDVDNIVGISDKSDLKEMDPPNTMQSELRSYQKQALHWMIHLEKGRCFDEAATTLHPCWNAYHLADERKLILYLNAFSGEATTKFPSALQMARGGILADAMGLGKTIMAISLMLTCSDKGCSYASSASQASIATNDMSTSGLSPGTPKKIASISSFSKLMQCRQPFIGGGNLIICPMTLLGQWKVLLSSLSIYVHYGQSRPKDAKLLAQYDVVLTTYGVLSSEFSAENIEEKGGLYSICWFRVVLDEAHTIKSSKSQISLAASALTADRRWCLTGTPIQNNLEDIFSLLRFLKVEPWGIWGLWYKLIQKPYEEGDQRGLKLVQSILRPIMLRRTKFSTDTQGRPILVLPPANVEVVYCEFTEAEKDFYDALFKRSKVKFDQYVEQGRVLHNYASILELLLRLRQCCDHPFLVMSRSDTQDFSDLNKLAKRFLKGGRVSSNVDSKDMPSSAYVEELVNELRKGEKGECPICLEAFEDAVLTPCAHCLCRECLLASWRCAASGPCPICRRIIHKTDLITAPTDSRFQVDIENNWVESSKVSMLLKELEILCSSGLKGIIFSQWTAFLDILQVPLSRKNISFVRLDGTLNQQQREKVINQFSEEKSLTVLLMSLKAGGVGINLTAASHAFLLDPWWNPAVEEQAVMRIHRIGQTKSVSIKRFIVKGTVEEKMEAVQARKQRMISGALTDQEVRTARIEELKMLFN